MSAMLTSLLDPERLADCLRHEPPATTDLQRVRTAIRRAPLRSLDDCSALLSECVSRIEQFGRDNKGVKFDDAIGYLADAEAALDAVVLQTMPTEDPRDEFDHEGNL